jgi:hypothetical protein
MRYEQAVSGSVLRMVSGTAVYQFNGLGGDQPVNMHPLETDVRFTASYEEDYLLFEKAAAKGEPVDLYLDVYMIDLWLIAAANANQTIWKTSRKLPYSLSGISHATRPPKAFIDTTVQTIITSGTPIAGEVKIPDTGGFQDIETPSGIAGTYLEVRYPALFVVKLLDIRRDYRAANELRFDVSMLELLQNTYTAGSP